MYLHSSSKRYSIPAEVNAQGSDNFVLAKMYEGDVQLISHLVRLNSYRVCKKREKSMQQILLQLFKRDVMIRETQKKKKQTSNCWYKFLVY